MTTREPASSQTFHILYHRYHKKKHITEYMQDTQMEWKTHVKKKVRYLPKVIRTLKTHSHWAANKRINTNIPGFGSKLN